MAWIANRLGLHSRIVRIDWACGRRAAEVDEMCLASDHKALSGSSMRSSFQWRPAEISCSIECVCA